MKMKRTTIALILASALVLLVIALPAVAQESAGKEELPVYVNGLLENRCILVNGQAYTSADEMALIYGIDGSGWYDFDTGDSEFSGDDLLIQYHGGNQYCTANGRYLYMPEGIVEVEGVAYYPLRVLAKIFGLGLTWNAELRGIELDTSNMALLENGESYYGAREQDLLARIIWAESGNQPFEGMIAVGNVVLNRVASERFPNTVYDVVYQAGQFDPVRNGSINAAPSDEAVLASYLCLEGVNTVGDALFFQNPSTSGVLFSGLSYITTIGDHVFYR